MNQPQMPRAVASPAPLGGSLPSSNYWSAEHFEDEIEYVFRRSWINVCREQQVSNPGDFLVQDLYALGTSVLLVRGRDGQLRAFHNMCAHRGNRVEVEPRGNKSGFRCLFHGWMYDLKGNLAGLPQAHKFCSVDQAREGLRPVHVDVWGGFVHVCLAPTPPCSLAEFMQPIAARLGDHFGAQPWYLGFSLGVEVNCNWKLPYDAVSEFYHFDALHPKSIAGGMSVKDTVPTVYADQAGVVGHFEAFYAPSQAYLEPTPVQRLSAELGAAGVHTKSAAIARQTRFPDAINIHKQPDWAVDMYVTLPHAAYLIQEQSIGLQRSWPIALDRCYVTLEIWTLNPPPTRFSELFNLSSVKSRTVDVLVEDFSTLERIQANLRHGPVRNFHYGADEALVKGFQDLLQVWIDRGKAAA